MSFFGHRARGRLQRRLFFWFGASILLTGLVVGATMHLVGQLGGTPWRKQVERVQRFVGGRFEHVWDNPAERSALAEAIGRDLEMHVVVVDAEGRPVAGSAVGCSSPMLSAPVRRGEALLGEVRVCMDRGHASGLWSTLLPILLGCAILWGVSGKIARRIARPLAELARVAQEIGGGRLSARARMGHRDHAEARVVAEAINDMAGRIEKQMADQRELLAAVSHELRTPLSRMRLLTELAREKGSDAKALNELDREVMEIDALVGDLLANSRIDFAAMAPKPLDAVEVARRALERAGLEPSLLQVESNETRIQADPTLLARALANLLENAKRHAGGALALRVRSRPLYLSFEVEDAGPGFAPGEQLRVFEAFYRRAQPKEDSGSLGLGLGLALVKRIATAHGGSAFASNRPGGGARVGIEISTSGV